MMKINLISKKSRAYRGRNWSRIIGFVIFGLFGLYFVSVSLFVIISLISLKSRISKTNEQSSAISATMLKNNDKLSRFVLTKLILTKLQDIEKGRFRYKEYLDQVSLLLPSGSLLSAVDFKSKGWIAVSVSSSDLISFKQLEGSILNSGVWTNSKYFSGAYIENVSREKSGAYSVKLQLQLKNLNG